MAQGLVTPYWDDVYPASQTVCNISLTFRQFRVLVERFVKLFKVRSQDVTRYINHHDVM